MWYERIKLPISIKKNCSSKKTITVLLTLLFSKRSTIIYVFFLEQILQSMPLLNTD